MIYGNIFSPISTPNTLPPAVAIKDGQECFDKREESDEGYYDLVLMDIQMPILNGYDTTAKILPFLLSC